MGYSDAPPGWWQEFVLAAPAKTAKLAVVRADGAPHVAPVWVDLDGDQVVFMTNAVPPEMLIRVTPTRIVAKVNISE